MPNSYNEVIEAINAGAPISFGKRSDFGAAIQKWAHELVTTAAGNGRIPATAPAKVPGEVKGHVGGLRALFGR